MENTETKICNKCGIKKNISEFYECRTENRIFSICKECTRKNNKYFYKNLSPEEKENLLLKQRKCNKTPAQIERKNMVERQRQIKYKEKILLTNAHKRARLKGLEINIDIDDIIIPNICPVLGIPIYRDAALNSHSCPSLDRIDNSKGYVKGNVQVVSFRANAIKRDATIDELKRIIEYIEKFTIIS